jgi:hypothetical protein
LRTFVFRALQKQHFFAFAAYVLLRQSGRRKFSRSRGLLQLKPKTLLRCMSFGFERRGTKPPVAVAAKLVLCSCKYSLNYWRLRSVVSADRSDGKARQYNLLLWMPLGLQGIFDRSGHVISAFFCQACSVRLTWRRWPGW